MSLPKVEDARKLSEEELAEEILAAKRELFELRRQQATSELKETHQFKHTRHRLAQLMTVERERQIIESNKKEAHRDTEAQRIARYKSSQRHRGAEI